MNITAGLILRGLGWWMLAACATQVLFHLALKYGRNEAWRFDPIEKD